MSWMTIVHFDTVAIAKHLSFLKFNSHSLVKATIKNCTHKAPFLVYNFVVFTALSCTHGDVRLVGGETSYEGIVEICLSSTWMLVCGYNWNVNDSTVVCRQLTGELIPSEWVLLATSIMHNTLSLSNRRVDPI